VALAMASGNSSVQADAAHRSELGQLGGALNYMSSQLSRSINDLTIERNRLERYIASIDDSLLRQIFTYRFVNGLAWEQVAACVGGGNSAGSVKMACHRYLRRD